MSSGGSASHLRLIAGAREGASPSGSNRSSGTRAHLRTVVDAAKQGSTSVAVRRPAHESQGWLFPDQTLLGMVDMSEARAEALEGLLRTTRPRWLMDLRTVPLFDYGMMNRRRFFSLFERLGIIYRDVSGLAELSSRKDASLSSGAIAVIINELLSEHPVKRAAGPILFLLENAARAAVAEQVLPLLVQPQPEEGWTVCRYQVR
jgi:hypothetical protein